MKNWFYFIVGIVAVFSAITHTIEGLTTALPALREANLEYMTQSIFTFNYHIVAADHFGIGIALIIMAFNKNTAITKSAAFVVIAINFARVVVSVIIIFTTMHASGSAGTFWIPAIANSVCILLLFMGMRVKEIPPAR